MTDRRPHVVIVVVNLPAERDRRVIRECQGLESAGYRATVISPRGPHRPRRLPGTAATEIRSFPQPFAGTGVLSFALEFSWALLAVTGHLLVLLMRGRVSAVQACNPPDIFWPIALLVRALGRPFVFDHHDLSPELYDAKAGQPNPGVLRLLRLFERLSWHCASTVVVTNESFRDVAIARGGCPPDKIVVVRNGPALTEVGPPPPATTPAPRAAAEPACPLGPGGRHRIVYVGVINEQDRVDVAVRAAERLARLRGTEDWELVIAGDGESLPELRRLAAELGIAELVRFTGWLELVEVDEVLRSASVAIQPDQPSPMADLYTMAKTVEYVARGIPVVAADLRETRRTAGDAARYLPHGTPEEFAQAIDQLLDDPATRAAMGAVGRLRFAEELAWEHQVKAYLRVWDRLLRPAADRSGTPTAPGDRLPA
jgi:glycosyltransferase involved in cell wall biosynthesis